MKNKSFALFALTALMLTLIVGVASAVTMAQWNFEATNLVPSTDITSGATMTLSDSRTATFPGGNAPSALVGMSSTGWDVADRYIELDLSTAGYENIILRFDEQASTLGPVFFKVQYSSDGVVFTDLPSSTTSIAVDPLIFTANPMHTFDLSSVTSTDNNVNAKLRIVVPSTGIGSSATGTFRIDNVLIEGTALVLPTDVVQCSTTGNFGDNLVVSIDDINVDEGFGGEDEDFEWFPLDTITVDVDIDNNGPNDIDNVALGWGLYDKTSGKWVIDDEESDFDLNDDDTETKTLTFKLNDNVDDFDSSHNYVFYAWANGDDNEVDPNVPTCDYASQDIDMQIEEFVILDELQYPTTAVQCKEEVTITGDVWNLDDGNQQDDVYILVTNVALGLKEQRMEIGDIDALESTPFEFMFKVPEGMDEKTYPITFDVYDDHNDIYENSFNKESSFMVPLTVKGNCGAVAGSATVSATLESGGKAGEAMVVKTTVTNKGTKTATFTINAAGYSAWASAASVSEDSFTLEAGKSKDVTITLQTKAEAKGEQTLNVEVLSGNELVMTQPVEVMVQGSSAGFLSAITGNAVGDGKSLWIIGALNVLLVFAIIVIAIRFMLRR